MAVLLTLGMNVKNNYSVVLFLNAMGVASISKEDLLSQFGEQYKLAMMDYVDPLQNFGGLITARVMDTLELRRSVEAFEQFHRFYPYPPDYESKLRVAIDRGQEPRLFGLSVQAEV
ncbi:MAG: hypothetical protein IPK83_08485 [Planctomycetes bacterium]|nr:hypothetical protein [Planctomycetota bacterium]